MLEAGGLPLRAQERLTRRAEGARPALWTSDLSGQAALLLLQAGYVLVGVALGCCAYYVLTDWSDEQQMHSSIGGSWANSEMQHYTAATHQARHLAMRSMADDARRLGAQGIVGSDVHFHVHEIQARRQSPYSNETETFEDHIVEFIAVSTAIAENGGGHQPVHASLALDISR